MEVFINLNLLDLVIMLGVKIKTCERFNECIRKCPTMIKSLLFSFHIICVVIIHSQWDSLVIGLMIICFMLPLHMIGFLITIL